MRTLQWNFDVVGVCLRGVVLRRLSSLCEIAGVCRFWLCVIDSLMTIVASSVFAYSLACRFYHFPTTILPIKISIRSTICMWLLETFPLCLISAQKVLQTILMDDFIVVRQVFLCIYVLHELQCISSWQCARALGDLPVNYSWFPGMFSILW